MIILDFWEVFSVGQSLYVLGTDLLSFKPKIIEVESVNSMDFTFICIEGKIHKLAGVQGLNTKNIKFLNNWLEVKNININDVKRVNIFE